MKCDRCENEATVHEVTVQAGVKVEKHLCESCAAGEGLTPPAPAAPEVLKALIETTAKRASRGPACPTCGMTFDEFKQCGQFGCANCYEAFEARLLPLIERAHEGATQHLGKRPRRATGQVESSRAKALAALIEERASRASAIRRLLEEAVKAEQYERAAELRDELRRLTDAPPGATA